MVTRAIRAWIKFASTKTENQAVVMAGIGLLYEADNAKYYARIGFQSLFDAALEEVYGPSKRTLEEYRIRI